VSAISFYKMFGPMTSSPKRKSKQKEAGIVSDSIWCGEVKESNCPKNPVNGLEQVNLSAPTQSETVARPLIKNVRIRVEEELRDLAQSGHTQELLELLEDGAPFVVDMDGQTVLHIAATSGHFKTVEALLDRGCDANVQDFTGHTALQRASAGGHLEIVKLLINQGASLDHQDEMHGNTALHEASWKGFSLTLSVLCNSKANVYMKNRGGFTPLHLCCQNGHNQSCRVLLLHGCRPDVKNNYGDTPFHTAARYGHAGVIRILVSAKCKVSEQNKNGDTSLHIAAAMGRKKLTKILVESGMDTNIRNKQSETACDIALRKNLSEIVSILRSNVIERPLQSIISDLDPDANDSHEVKAILELGLHAKRESSIRSKQKKSHSRQPSSKISPRLPTYDSTDLSSMTSSTSSFNSIRAEQKYQKKSKGRQGEKGEKGGCDCGPFLEKIGKTIEKDRKEILTHIDQNNKKIHGRLESFEKKTKNQMFNFNQNMKECFADERNDCQDRMDRRFLKDNIELERQQTIRDIMIKRDIARWLQAKLSEIEKRHGLEAENRAMLRKLTRKKSRRETRAVISEIKNGTLRRAHSAELISELGESEMDDISVNDPLGRGEDNYHIYHGLRIGNQPKGSNLPSSPDLQSAPIRTRVRHNSEGNYDDVSLMQETILNARAETQNCNDDSDRVYQNLIFHQNNLEDRNRFKNEARVRVPLPNGTPIEYLDSEIERRGTSLKSQDSRPEQRLANLISENLPAKSSSGMNQDKNQNFTHVSLSKHKITNDSDSSPLPDPLASDHLVISAPNKPRASHYEHLTNMSTGNRFYQGENNDTTSSTSSMASLNSLGLPVARFESVSQSSARPNLVGIPMTSDTGSLDSHNDSGYSTRLGISDGASPSLSGSTVTDSEPLLDPQAIYMIPHEWDHSDVSSSENTAPSSHTLRKPVFNVMINSKSSLV